MSAPKMSDERREELEHFCCSETNRRPSNALIEADFVEMTRNSPMFGRMWRLTDAGRAALKEPK